MTLPNFVGIGVQRAATTWVHNCLAEHPDVFVPAAKELAFFDEHHDRGLAWYESQFADRAGEPAVGEITPSYLHKPGALQRLAETLPDARLFVILREPIERAYSAYQLHPEQHPDQDFSEACTRSENYLVAWSLYADRMVEVYRLFRRERVRVFLYDEVQADPESLLSDLFGFLDVDPAFRPSAIGKTYNRAVFPMAQQALGRLGLGWSVGLVKRTPLAEAIKKIHKSGGERERDRVRAMCPAGLRARFRDDLGRLEGIIERDLSRWK